MGSRLDDVIILRYFPEKLDFSSKDEETEFNFDEDGFYEED